MCNDFSININNSDYNIDLGNELDYTITIDEVPDVVINLNEQGPAGMQGEKGDQGIQGPQGVGVDRVEPISQQGYEITYRMYFTDGRYYDYVVSNGTGSLKWLHIEESDWTLVGDRYRYTYYGNYGVIELFEGTISSKSKIEFNSTVEGNTTYLYVMQPIEGYALVASIEGEQVGVYIYEQEIASDSWTINHNLNTYPSITIVDSGGNTVIGSENYIDKNTVEIKFSAAFTGKAYLNYTR
jgi:hypothetical protein